MFMIENEGDSKMLYIDIEKRFVGGTFKVKDLKKANWNIIIASLRKE